MVVLGIPVIALVLGAGWMVVRPKVIENTGGRIKAVWSKDGPTYPPPPRTDEELYREGMFSWEAPPSRRATGSTASGAGRTRR